MKLKEYQERALKDVKVFLEQLAVWRPQAFQRGQWLFDFAEKAWEEAGVGRTYLKKKDGLKRPLPVFCLKIPTGGGKTLLAVKTIAYSDSASGVYVSTEMFGKLGIADEMKDKARKIPATPVGEIVARGEAEIGFQQMSELKPVEGIDIVGPLPDELQKITIFSAGIATVSKEPDAGNALIKFLASPAARAELIKSGMDPIPAGGTN